MDQKKRLLLLYPGAFYSPGWGSISEANTHMIYVYSFLKRYFEVTAIDLEMEFSKPSSHQDLSLFKERSLNRIFSVDVDYVAISCWSSLNYLSTKFFAEQIKEKNPLTKIIVGGYHPTFVEKDFKYKNSPFDYIVKGEVDNVLKVLGHATDKSNHGKMIKPDFQSYPYSAFNSNLGIFLSTGCPFNCTYCMEYRRKWIPYSVSDAITTILEIQNKISPKAIMILDACFGVNKGWRKEFFSELIKCRPNCGFWIQTRVDLIDDEDLELMSQLNLKIDLGVDSFSKTMLGIMNKTGDADSYLRKFLSLSKKCSELKIEHDAYLIFNHPGESEKTLMEHEDFFENRVFPTLKEGYLSIRSGTFSLFPGSFVFNNLDYYMDEYGTSVEHPEWWKEENDQQMLSRRLTPTVDRNGKPFIVTPHMIKEAIGNFNKMSQRSKMRQT